MNYNEIAEGYDKLADALTLQLEAVKPSNKGLGHEATVLILEMRERAASARGQATYDARNLEKDEFERARLKSYLELEERTVAARELQASAMVRQANCYETLVGQIQVVTKNT